MFKSWKIGRLAGIDLFIHPTFWLLMLFVLITESTLWTVAFVAAIFGCVVLHELGHALTARLFGVGTRDITLYPIGGVARLNRMPRSPGAEFLITLAGPATNLAIAGVLWAGLQMAGALEPGGSANAIGGFVSQLLRVNLVLAAFNMIPAFPMDGGRIVRALLAGWVGRLRATEMAAGLGQTLSIVLPLVTLYLNMFSFMHVLLALFVYSAAAAELASVRAEAAFARRAVPMRTPPPGYRWVNCGGGVWQLVPLHFATDASGSRPWM